MKTLIQAVPWVAERAMNAQCLSAATGASVAWDKVHSGYDTYLDILRAVGGDSLLLIEDDVALTADFTEKVLKVIGGHPADVIQFFSVYPGESGYLPGSQFAYTLCHYLPERTAEFLLEFAEFWERDQDFPEQDQLIRDYLTGTHKVFWMEHPSLVQHLRWPSVTNPARSVWRISPTFVP